MLFIIATGYAVSAPTKASLASKRTIPWSPPTIGSFQDVVRPTVATELIQRLDVVGTPITLEETKLKEVQRRFGGIIGKHGDASEAVEWLCIQGGDNGGRWVLWLTSSEVSGHSIDGFQSRRLPPDERADDRCHSLPATGRVIDIPPGINLGMTEAEVNKRPGEPTSARHDVLYFWHDAKLMLRKEPFTEDDSVKILLRKGDVWGIEAEKDTTN